MTGDVHGEGGGSMKILTENPQGTGGGHTPLWPDSRSRTPSTDDDVALDETRRGVEDVPAEAFREQPEERGKCMARGTLSESGRML